MGEAEVGDRVKVHFPDGRLRAGQLVSRSEETVTIAGVVVRFDDNGQEERVVLGHPLPALV